MGPDAPILEVPMHYRERIASIFASKNQHALASLTQQSIVNVTLVTRKHHSKLTLNLISTSEKVCIVPIDPIISIPLMYAIPIRSNYCFMFLKKVSMAQPTRPSSQTCRKVDVLLIPIVAQGMTAILQETACVKSIVAGRHAVFLMAQKNA